MVFLKLKSAKEIETGINIVDILNEKQDFLSPMAKQDVTLTIILFQ
jgi:hypothetical protein